jgi:hypothetical protein
MISAGWDAALTSKGVKKMDDFFAGDSHDITAKLAYRLWEQRGRPYGSPDVDWFAAEKALSAQRDAKLDFPLYGITLEANEGPFIPGVSANQT